MIDNISDQDLTQKLWAFNYFNWSILGLGFLKTGVAIFDWHIATN